MSTFNIKTKSPEQKFLDREYSASSRIDDHTLQVGLGKSEDYIPTPEAYPSQENSSEVAHEVNQEISDRLEELVGVIDEYTEFIATRGGLGENAGELVKPWNDLYNHYVTRAAKMNQEDYANLPQSTKDVLQVMNRSKQIRHMQLGSTVYDEFGDVLSEAETAEYIDDFCSTFEDSLQSNGIELKLERPKEIGSINAVLNMVYLAVDAFNLEKEGTDSNEAITIALRQTIKPFIEAPRQRLAAVLGQELTEE